MSTKERPMHWQKHLTARTVCGVSIYGFTIIHTTIFPQDVTCAKCLKYLAKTSVCPKCFHEFPKENKQ